MHLRQRYLPAEPAKSLHRVDESSRAVLQMALRYLDDESLDGRVSTQPVLVEPVDEGRVGQNRWVDVDEQGPVRWKLLVEAQLLCPQL